MKKNKMPLVLAALFLLIANGQTLSAGVQNSSIEFRSAAFFHSADRFRDVYGKVGVSYQVEASTPLYGCLNGWTNFDWFSKHGKSEGFNDPTTIRIANISLGVKIPYQRCERFTPYIGIGPSFSRLWLKDTPHCSQDTSSCGSQNAHKTVSKWVVGGVLKTGVNCFVTKCLFLDVFVDYLYQPIHFEKRVDIGGIKAGLGIGYRF